MPVATSLISPFVAPGINAMSISKAKLFWSFVDELISFKPAIQSIGTMHVLVLLTPLYVYGYAILHIFPILPLIFILSVITILFIQFSDQFVFYDRLLSRVNNGEDFRQNESYTERIKIIELANNSIIRNPVFGSGIGSYGIKVYHDDGKSSPHNIIVEILFETGIIGITVFSLFLYKIYRQIQIASSFEPNKLFSGINLVIAFLFMFILISGVFEDLMIVYFWLGIFLANIGTSSNNVHKNIVCVE